MGRSYSIVAPALFVFIEGPYYVMPVRQTETPVFENGGYGLLKKAVLVWTKLQHGLVDNLGRTRCPVMSCHWCDMFPSLCHNRKW